MPIDLEKFKQDPRSPQELAKAILDRELVPAVTTMMSPSWSFREHMLTDPGDPCNPNNAFCLLEALKRIAEDIPYGEFSKTVISHGLEVIDHYRQRAAEARDGCVDTVNSEPPPSLERVPDLAWLAEEGAWEARQRQAAEDMEMFVGELSNLNAIEKLLRALAHKLGISLIEPGRRK